MSWALFETEQDGEFLSMKLTEVMILPSGRYHKGRISQILKNEWQLEIGKQKLWLAKNETKDYTQVIKTSYAEYHQRIVSTQGR